MKNFNIGDIVRLADSRYAGIIIGVKSPGTFFVGEAASLYEGSKYNSQVNIWRERFMELLIPATEIKDFPVWTEEE